MPFYRNIFKQGWGITWHNKYLWFFGIFAALLGGGGEYEILIRSLSSDSSQTLFPGLKKIIDTGIFSWQTIDNLKLIIREDFVSFAIALLTLLVILLLLGFLIWLSVISQIAVVNNSSAIIDKKKNNIRIGVESGMKNFWPVLGLNILIKAMVYGVFAAISLPIVLSIAKLGPLTVNLLYLLAFIVFIPIAVSLSFIIKYAIAYLVIRGESFAAAIKGAWQLFLANWLVSVEMAIILFFINLLASFAIILFILTLTVPFIFLALIFYYIFSTLGSWIVIILALLTLLLVIVAGGAALATFQISSWTNLFLVLDKKGGTSKIIRVLDGLMKT